MNLVRNQNLSHQHQLWVRLQLAPCSIAVDPSALHLPPLIPPPVSNSSCQFTHCQLLDASSCPTLLYFSRYYKIKNVFFFCFYILFVWKYYKPTTVQYYIADYVSWEPKLTLLGLWTTWTYEHTFRTELIHMQGIYCNKLSPVSDPGV